MTSKFLIAPCAYKGSFDPIQLCDAIKSGIEETMIKTEIKSLPLADGGDGTIQSLHYLLGGILFDIEVTGATGKPVQANWLMLKSKDSKIPFSIVELASASGIAHLSESELAPLTANTKGLGEVVKDCLKKGVKDIIITVGGSASTDGAMGILSELGAKFQDRDGFELPAGGGSLLNVSQIDLDHLDKNLNNCSFKIVTDVDNPLYGEYGAASIYAPQKGATKTDVQLLDDGLKNYAHVIERSTGKNLAKQPGMGAAGGVPFGLCSFLKAEILNGFTWFSELVKLENHIQYADIVVTGEGFLDSQSLQGKAIGQLARLCKKHKKRLWVIPAKFEKEIAWNNYGIELVKETATEGNATLADVRKTVKILCQKSFTI